MADPFEPPPPFGQNVDEKGNVILSREEVQNLRQWLERFTQHLSDEYD